MKGKYFKIESMRYKSFLLLIVIAILACNNISFSGSIDKNASDYSVSDKVKIKKATMSKVVVKKKGFVSDNTGTYYYDNNGNLMKNYLYHKNGDTFYTDSNGKFVTNTWLTFNKRTVETNEKIYDASYHVMYFEANGKAKKNRRNNVIDGRKFSFDKSGYLISEPYEPLKNSTKFDKDKFTTGIKDLKVGDYTTFGKYKLETNLEYNQDIMWDVLDIKDDKILLYSTFILDTADFDENDSVEWEQSSIRKWLNDTFLKTSFESKDEQNIIKDTDIVTNGKVTKDKIFLLSSDEVKKYYGKYEDDIGQNEKLATIASNFARYRNVEMSYKDNYWYYKNSPFWLRDKATKDGMVKVVGVYGHIYDDGDKVKPDVNYGIRPAIWVSKN